MTFVSLTELSDHEILHRLKQHDLWQLQDMVLFAYGYEYKDVSWDYIIDMNLFPIRQYHAALEGVNDTNPKTQLRYVHKEPFSSQFVICHVKKGTFLKWAIKRWPHEPRVEKVHSLWKKYKNQSLSTAPSLQTQQAIIKNYGDKLQLAEFIKHCEKHPAISYKANISKIAKQAKAELANIPYTYSTFKKYIQRMSLQELMQLQSKSLNLG